MNTTYDVNFRFKALVGGVNETLHQWRRTEPTLVAVANSIKGWQGDWNTLHNIMQRQGRKSAYKANIVRIALDDAWHHRDNRNLAIKSVSDALSAMQSVASEDEQDDFVPVYRHRAAKAVFGDNYRQLKQSASAHPPVEVRVKSWANEMRRNIEGLETIPQENRNYIAYNPHLEGAIYQRAALSVKSWIHDNFGSVMNDLTSNGRQAIKAIDEEVNQIAHLSRVGLLDDGTRREIHARLRNAYKMIDGIQPEMRTPAVKAALFQDVDMLRGRLDGLMPLLEYGRYHESDLFRDVTESITLGRNIYEAAPVKFMPPDTWNNFNNLDRSLSQVLVHKNPAVRVKALRAAAANLDIISRDLAGLEGAVVRDQ